jgi:hypothetical protein
MAVQSGQATVATAAKPIATGNNFAHTPATVVIANGAAVIAVGGDATVTTTTGLLVAANTTVSIPLRAGEALWAISATSSTVSYIVTGN